MNIKRSQSSRVAATRYKNWPARRRVAEYRHFRSQEDIHTYMDSYTSDMDPSRAFVGPRSCTVDTATHTLTQVSVSVQQHFMSLEGSRMHTVRHIKAVATLPDDAVKRHVCTDLALGIALAHQHDMPFTASAAVLSTFPQLLSYDAELCYIPYDLVASLPVTLERLCVRAGRDTLESQIGDLGRLVNLRTLELDTPPAAAAAEFRTHLEAAVPEGCELILHTQPVAGN